MAKEIIKVQVKGRLLGGGTFEPRETDGGTYKYSACIALEPDEEKKLTEAREKAIEAEFGSKRPGKINDYVVRMGDDPEYENTYDQYFVNTSSKDSISWVVKSDDGIFRAVEKEDNIIYPGCYVVASLTVYAYPGKKNVKPGVTTAPRAIMFWKDGEPLGDKFDANDEFGSFDSELDDEDDFLATAS